MPIACYTTTTCRIHSCLSDSCQHFSVPLECGEYGLVRSSIRSRSRFCSCEDSCLHQFSDHFVLVAEFRFAVLDAAVLAFLIHDQFRSLLLDTEMTTSSCVTHGICLFHLTPNKATLSSELRTRSYRERRAGQIRRRVHEMDR
jgi:hypothetical protein